MVIMVILASTFPTTQKGRFRSTMSGSTLVPIDFVPMPNAVESNVLANDIIADTVGPNLKAPLTDALAFKLLDFWWWAERVGRKMLESFKNLLLGSDRKPFKVALESRGEDDIKTSPHALAISTRIREVLQIFLKANGLTNSVLLGGGLEAPLELRIEFFQYIIKITDSEEDGGRFTTLGDDKPRSLVGHLLEDRTELGTCDVGRNGSRHGTSRHLSPPLYR
jgi:hypothetical protein